MAIYPNYSMPMNNGYGYNQQMPLQNPYQQRMDFLQNYQQNLQQPVQQMQMPVGINGKIVPSIENVTANDVPMDGSIAVFPKQDMSEIYIKFWENNGTIRTIVFKPVLENTPNNLPQADEKTILSLSESVTGAFMERFDSLERQINELMTKPMTKSMAKPMTSKTKKEVAENE